MEFSNPITFPFDEGRRVRIRRLEQDYRELWGLAGEQSEVNLTKATQGVRCP
jgi:hypothetical protein